MRPRSITIAVVIAIASVLGIAVVTVTFWQALGVSEMSVGGWLALILGGMVMLGLGCGLMALMFISNRRGFDELDRDDR